VKRLSKGFAHAALVVGLPALGAGCASWPERPQVTAAAQAMAQVPGFGHVRQWTDAPLPEWKIWQEKWLADRAAAGIQTPPTLLAISSGSDQGAFGAGYLAGWTQRGDRPQFDVVTGISTGALIAPFAFLGPQYDATLHTLYTTIRAKDIYRARPLGGLTGGPSFADSKPLRTLIARYVTIDLLDRIAAEHRRGRRLLVATTNLDAGRGVVWDLGAIADSHSPTRVALARKALLASASIPGMLPPVLINVSAGTQRFAEMHVDGGTAGSVFGLPPAVIWTDQYRAPAQAGASITILYNGKIFPRYEVVQPRAFTILGRALDTLIGESDRDLIRSYRQFAQEHGIAFGLVAIDHCYELPRTEKFDRASMRRLYAQGLRQALAEPPMPSSTARGGVADQAPVAPCAPER